mgnify:FL=1
MSLTHYKISIIVTGVTGLLRVKSTPRNTVKALHHLTFSDLVTPVTGLCARARVKKKLFNLLILISKAKNIFLTCEKTARNTRNTCNNHCFYYIFNFSTRNKSAFTRNKSTCTRNNQQGM